MAVGIRRSIGALLATLVLVGIAGCAGSAPSGGAAGDTTITDVLGRQVQVKAPSSRILLGGSRLIYTTAILNPTDPTAGVVGWPNDLQQNDQDTYLRYAEKFPRVAQLPVLGQLPNGSFSAEQAIDLKPDVFVVSAANFPAARDAGTIDRLEQAGIPTVVVDYFVDPLRNSERSMEILGQLTGRQQQAQRYNDWYRAGMQKVRARLDAARPAPTPTYLWRAPGYYDCCSTFGNSNLGQLVTYAGGQNLGDTMIPGKQGTVSPEVVVARAPAVMLATGANWAPGGPATPGGFVSLGYEEPPERAQAQLQGLIAKQAGFSELPTVRDHRTYVVWHHFYDSPYNVLAVQWFAKWMHPELFGDVNPDDTLRDLHQQFLPVPAGGTFWTSLPGTQP